MDEPLAYLDNNASTRVDERVVAVLLPLLTENYGNPSSTHRFGAAVATQIEDARRSVAAAINAEPGEIVFTSGGTEADNAALYGVLATRRDRRRLVVSAVEHHAIREHAEALAEQGFSIDIVPVDANGGLRLDALAAAMREDTALVTVMLANNETGIIFPLAEVVRIAHERRVPVMSDAVNALGKMPVDVRALGVDLLALSGHKVHGPKGVGALYVRRGTPLAPLLIGGPQERHLRGGTQNSAGIVGFGAACARLIEVGAAGIAQMRSLRDELEVRLRAHFPECVIVGEHAPRLANTTCVCFPDCNAEALLVLLSEAGICASSGAACASGSVEPSAALRAMGIPAILARGQIRFSLSRYSTAGEIDRLFEILPDAVGRVRKLTR